MTPTSSYYWRGELFINSQFCVHLTQPKHCLSAAINQALEAAAPSALTLTGQTEWELKDVSELQPRVRKSRWERHVDIRGDAWPDTREGRYRDRQKLGGTGGHTSYRALCWIYLWGPDCISATFLYLLWWKYGFYHDKILFATELIIKLVKILHNQISEGWLMRKTLWMPSLFFGADFV